MFQIERLGSLSFSPDENPSDMSRSCSRRGDVVNDMGSNDDFMNRVDQLIETGDIVGIYFLEQDQQFPGLLDPEEELCLAQSIAEGRKAQAEISEGVVSDNGNLQESVDRRKKAEENLTVHNCRLVSSIALGYAGRGVPLSDLIQEGNLWLMKAVEKFDYKKGNRFSSYAYPWIRQGVSRALHEQSRVIRLPVNVSVLVGIMNGIKNRLTGKFGEEPTDEEIAKEYKRQKGKEIKTSTVGELLKYGERPVSLQTGVRKGGDNFLIDQIESEAQTPEEEALLSLLIRSINDELEKVLSAKEVRILGLRYGLNGNLEHTLEEVGQKYGLTRERIRQIEAGALRKLKHPSRSRWLRDYY